MCSFFFFFLFNFLFIRIRVTEDGRQALLSLAHGDMRRVINILQSTSMAFDEVNEENVYTCVGMKFFYFVINGKKYSSRKFHVRSPFEIGYCKCRFVDVKRRFNFGLQQ